MYFAILHYISAHSKSNLSSKPYLLHLNFLQITFKKYFALLVASSISPITSTLSPLEVIITCLNARGLRFIFRDGKGGFLLFCFGGGARIDGFLGDRLARIREVGRLEIGEEVHGSV